MAFVIGGICLFSLLLALAGRPWPSGQPWPPGQSTIAADEQWQQSLLQWRQRKDEEFKTSPTSPLAGMKRSTLLAGKEYSFIFGKGDIRIFERKIDAARILLKSQDQTWFWYSFRPGLTCTIDGQDVPSGSPLNGRALIRLGHYTFQAVPSSEDLILQIFDPERPKFKNFQKLLYFPPDANFAVPAKLEKIPDPVLVKMLTSLNLEKVFYRYALIRFQIDGQFCQLTAYKSSLEGDEAGLLFIPFTDLTSGVETYAAGRFLEIDEPLTAEFILDFNYSFNPLCNYSSVYNCPRPPRENNLNVAIKAGEKTYRY